MSSVDTDIALALTMNEVLSFDWGTAIIGVLDVDTELYTPYSGRRIVEGVQRVTECDGIVVSFNGNLYDLPKMAESLGLADTGGLRLYGRHDDMLEITSTILWPGNKPIIGGGSLEKRFRLFCGDEKLPASPFPDDPYIESNWRDCYMPAQLWRKWKRNELRRPS